ncbi:MAG: alanine-zipper protein [Thermodesulfobacteriota bacterium]
MTAGIRKKTFWIIMAALVGAAALMTSGCATTAQVEDLESRIDAVEQQASDAEAGADKAQTTAEDCCEDVTDDVEAAEKAASDAEASADKAEEAADKATKVFEKQMEK